MKIIKIINSIVGWNIGTGLQRELEEKINAELPADMSYQFHFNMGAGVQHLFFQNGELIPVEPFN